MSKRHRRRFKRSLSEAHHRHEQRRWAIELLGGKCSKCGYKGVALEFHHVDRKRKRFSISQAIGVVDYDMLAAELRLCALLCANCHREHHHEHGY